MLGSSEYQRQALERTIAVVLPALGTEVPVLACEDLILHKLLAGRILDYADIDALLRANLPALDLSYLAHWSETLGLDDDLEQIWTEALPDVPLPSTTN